MIYVWCALNIMIESDNWSWDTKLIQISQFIRPGLECLELLKLTLSDSHALSHCCITYAVQVPHIKN